MPPNPLSPSTVDEMELTASSEQESLHLRLQLGTLIVLLTVLYSAEPTTTKTLTPTEPYFSFIPREGGPGTLVHRVDY